jgi:uncharacterized protein YjbI with pentapeptide repeats
MTHIKIKHRFTDAVLFEGEYASIKDAVVEAVKKEVSLLAADLLGAYLQGADLLGAYLQGADFQGANLRHADLRDANFQGANLLRADLGGANFQGANLGDANLRHADLRHADLRHADLRYADFQDADLRGVDLRGVDLRGVDLRGVDLRDADLRGVNLRGANLRGANLLGANLSGVFWNGDYLEEADLLVLAPVSIKKIVAETELFYNDVKAVVKALGIPYLDDIQDTAPAVSGEIKYSSAASPKAIRDIQNQFEITEDALHKAVKDYTLLVQRNFYRLYDELEEKTTASPEHPA